MEEEEEEEEEEEAHWRIEMKNKKRASEYKKGDMIYNITVSSYRP